MPNNQYTITAGDTPKLLATPTGYEPGPTRTITVLRGLSLDDARDLAAAFTACENLLVRHTADPQFPTWAATLGVRTREVAPDDGHLCVSRLADLPAPTGSRWADHPITEAIGRILTVATALPDASGRAVRTELRTVLAKFDGPVCPATIGLIDASATFNVTTWVAEGDADDLVALVHNTSVEAFVAGERIVEFYSQPGHACDGLVNELVAADAEIFIREPDGVRLVAQLERTRRDVFDQLVADARTEPDLFDDPDVVEALLAH